MGENGDLYKGSDNWSERIKKLDEDAHSFTKAYKLLIKCTDETDNVMWVNLRSWDVIQNSMRFIVGNAEALIIDCVHLRRNWQTYIGMQCF